MPRRMPSSRADTQIAGIGLTPVGLVPREEFILQFEEVVEGGLRHGRYPWTQRSHRPLLSYRWELFTPIFGLAAQKSGRSLNRSSRTGAVALSPIVSSAIRCGEQ
jgi:hypothetical protein